MDRWTGILRVSLNPNSRVYFRVAVSLCFSPSSRTLNVPSTNAIFFNGDRVEGTGNPVIEKLSNLQNIADILVSKLGTSVNAWVVEASTFNGSFAIYKEFFRSVSPCGEPKSYDPHGFPALTSTLLLLSRSLEEVKKVISGGQQEPSQINVSSSCSSHQPKTIIIGFSKGGIVLNQLVSELAYSKFETPVNVTQRRENPNGENILEIHEENQIIPSSKDSLLNSISEVHYIDVGLNSPGAYLTDDSVIERIVDRMAQGAAGIRFVLHGTPRQWCDSRRPRIRDEKDKLYHLLEDAELKTGGKLQVSKRLYFDDQSPNLQMHFEIIEIFDFR